MYKIKETEKVELLKMLSQNKSANIELIQFLGRVDIDQFASVYSSQAHTYESICCLFGNWCFYYTNNHDMSLLFEIWSLIPPNKIAKLSIYGVDQDDLYEHITGNYREEILCKMIRSIEPSTIKHDVKRVSNSKDISLVHNLIQKIPHIDNGWDMEELEEVALSNRIYLIEQDGLAVCTGMVQGENTENGFLVSIGTDEHYRKRGYATSLVNKMCADLQAQGKEIYLYYSNAQAGKLYHALGFVPLAKRIDIANPNVYQYNPLMQASRKA